MSEAFFTRSRTMKLTRRWWPWMKCRPENRTFGVEGKRWPARTCTYRRSCSSSSELRWLYHALLLRHLAVFDWRWDQQPRVLIFQIFQVIFIQYWIFRIFKLRHQPYLAAIMPAMSNITDVYITGSTSSTSPSKMADELLLMIGSWTVELMKASSSKGDPGAQTEITHGIKHITSNPKPQRPTETKN